jgi:hypothetical protein
VGESAGGENGLAYLINIEKMLEGEDRPRTAMVRCTNQQGTLW